MNCRICDGRARFRFRLGPYRIMKCRRCGFGWPEPMPTEDELRAYYTGARSDWALDDSQNEMSRRRVAQRLLELAPRTGALLDVGCGFGHSLDTAREAGFLTFGVEMDEGRARIAADKGHRIHMGTLDSQAFPNVVFDAAIVSHVIEHMNDPVAFLTHLCERLSAGAPCYVACPNFGGLRAKTMGSHDHEMYPPEHIGYFTPSTLRRVCQNTGFQEIELSYRTGTHSVKRWLAFFCYLRFLRTRRYEHAGAGAQRSCRFVEGRMRFLKVPAYGAILATSWLLRPVFNLLGGDCIESYWRKA